jgi:hypothetical protein
MKVEGRSVTRSPGSDLVDEGVTTLVGKAPWRVRLGHGSFVTMDFGRRLPRDSDLSQEHGEWHLSIYLSAWRLDSDSRIVAGSEDSREIMESALTQLEGMTLDRVSVESPSLGLKLWFGPLVMNVFPTYSRDSEHWMLYTPSGAVLVAGPGATWRWDDDAPPEGNGPRGHASGS